MKVNGSAPTTWLSPTLADRERAVDMEPRLKPMRAVTMLTLAVTLVICGPWVGWWTLLPLALAAAAFAVTDRGLPRADHPEYNLALAWLVSELAIAGSVAFTSGSGTPSAAWLALPVVTLPARFSVRGVRAGVGLAGLLLVLSTFGVHPHYVLHHPQVTLFPLALIIGVAALSMALMQSDLAHRSASVIDPLTSMLNRAALRARVQELTYQSAVVHQSIGIVVGDIDEFKAINDTHGHATGDAVLRDVAYRMRKSLRAFDLAYRLGGEEFLVLLPGATPERAAEVAEELRQAIARDMINGVRVTMSFGVASSPPAGFDFERTFAEADAALYQAKRSGRNRVHVAGQPAAEPLPV